MTHTRKLYRYSRGSSTPETIYETYEQPRRDRAVYLAYLALWNVSWRFKPLHWLVEKIDDLVLAPIHGRTCNDDCVTGVQVSDGSTFKLCGRAPLCAWMDIKLYDLEHKNNTSVRSSVE